MAGHCPAYLQPSLSASLCWVLPPRGHTQAIDCVQHRAQLDQYINRSIYKLGPERRHSASQNKETQDRHALLLRALSMPYGRLSRKPEGAASRSDGILVNTCSIAGHLSLQLPPEYVLCLQAMSYEYAVCCGASQR